MQVALGDVTVATLVAAVKKATGLDMGVTVESRRRRRVVLRVKPPEDDDVSDAAAASQKAKIKTIASETFGSGSSVVSSEDDGEQVTKFTVRIAPGSAPRLSKKTSQRMVAEAVTSRLEGRWRTQFDLTNDQVEFARRVPLPQKFVRSTNPATPDLAESIPQAINEDGEVMSWDLSGVMAHMLKVGKTRTGKTVSLIGDAVEASRRGFRVYVLDPKRTEFLGLRDWPNVQFVATTVEQQVALVFHLKQLMDERYRLIEEEGAQETDFERVLFILDEYRQLVGNVADWWSLIKVSGMPAKCPVINWIGALLRMAGACRIHVDLGTQRPDAEFLDGEIRDNFSARGATGRLTPDGAQMTFDDQRIGTTIPLNIRGRGTLVGMDDRPREVQFIYTPDPRKATSEEDRQLLRDLMPDKTSWPKQQLVFPSSFEAGELVAATDRKTCQEWEMVLASQLVDTDEPSLGPQWDRHGLVRPGRRADAAPDDEDLASSRLPVHDDDDQDDLVEDTAALQDDDTTSGGDIDGYEAAEYVAPDAIRVGDLILSPDAEGTWVVVTGTEPNEDDQLIIEWRDDDDTEGEVVASTEEMLEVRRPTVD